MDNRITQDEIRRSNRQQIYHYIYNNPKSSSPGICSALGLSRPTVASNLSSLENEGLIRRVGLQESVQIGRRPVLYAVDSRYRIAVGLEILRTKVNIIAVDLYGQQVAVVSPRIPYHNDNSYYREICSHVISFIDSLNLPPKRVLGICITLQGLVSPDGRTLVYGGIFGNTGTSIEVFENHLPYPCSFIHDPAAAAMSELQASPDLTSAIYLSLSSHLGGSLIVDRHIKSGRHGHHATFEHIRAFTDGKLCYCGQRGCWDTVCSMTALLGDEMPEAFFEKLREGDPERTESWTAFLTHLARLIKDLHLVNDVDIILGGRLAPFFREEDVAFLYREIRRMCPFEEETDFILLSRLPAYHIAIGAALKYIHAFLENIEDEPETDEENGSDLFREREV